MELEKSNNISCIEEQSQNCYSPFSLRAFEEYDNLLSPHQDLERSGTQPHQANLITPQRRTMTKNVRKRTHEILCVDPSHDHTIPPSEEKFNMYFCSSKDELHSPYKRPYSISRSRDGNSFLSPKQKCDNSGNDVNEVIQCDTNVNNPSNNNHHYTNRSTFYDRPIYEYIPQRRASSLAAFSTQQPRHKPSFHGYSSHIFKSPTRHIETAGILDSSNYDVNQGFSSLFPLDSTFNELNRSKKEPQIVSSAEISKGYKERYVIDHHLDICRPSFHLQRRDKRAYIPVRSSSHDTRQRLRRHQRELTGGYILNDSHAAPHFSGLNTTILDHNYCEGNNIHNKSDLINTLVHKLVKNLENKKDKYQHLSKGTWAANSKRYRDIRVENVALMRPPKRNKNKASIRSVITDVHDSPIQLT